MLRREFLSTVGAGLAAATASSLPEFARARGSDADERLFQAGLSLPVGPSGRCDEARVGGPVVRWDAAIGQWRMWYYCRDTSFQRRNSLFKNISSRVHNPCINVSKFFQGK